MGPHHWTQHPGSARGAGELSLSYFLLCELHHQDDMFALIHEANKSLKKIALKTLNWVTTKEHI